MEVATGGFYVEGRPAESYACAREGTAKASTPCLYARYSRTFRVGLMTIPDVGECLEVEYLGVDDAEENSSPS